jgi:hypothetical protein
MRISNGAALQKNTRPERQQTEIERRIIFMGSGSFKTLITSRKVSIYCGITFLEVVLKKKRINPFIETRYQCL